MGTRYCPDIGFLLGFHCVVDRLSIEIEVRSSYDIFFQHHDVLAIRSCNVKLHVMEIPNVILISDKDGNALLFHLTKYTDKFYGNIVRWKLK